MCKMDEHFVGAVRMLVSATAPPTKADVKYRSEVLTAEPTRDYLAHMAAGGWSGPLVAMLRGLRSIVSLERIGFVTNPGFAERLGLVGAEVRL